MRRSGIGRSPHSINLKINMIMAKSVKKARSAKTGQFVTMSYAKKHPNTTVVEKVKVGPTKHRDN